MNEEARNNRYFAKIALLREALQRFLPEHYPKLQGIYRAELMTTSRH